MSSAPLPSAPLPPQAPPSAPFRPAGVLLDLDGTLIDSLPDLELGVNGMLADLGLPPLDPSTVQAGIGRGIDRLIAHSLAALGRDVPADGSARRAFDVHYERASGTASRVFDGVVPALQRLRDAGVRLACVTNKAGRFVPPLLQRHRLDGFFDTWIGGDVASQRKPAPGMLVEIARRWQVPAATLAMIGDSAHDAHAARAAGMPVWLVTYGYAGSPTPQALLEAGQADGIVDSIDTIARAWVAPRATR